MKSHIVCFVMEMFFLLGGRIPKECIIRQSSGVVSVLVISEDLVCLMSYFLSQRANESHDQRFKFVVISMRGNWVIYRNSIVRVTRTNVPEKFSTSNCVANQITLCIESTFGFLKFAANRLRVVSSTLKQIDFVAKRP